MNELHGPGLHFQTGSSMIKQEGNRVQEDYKESTSALPEF